MLVGASLLLALAAAGAIWAYVSVQAASDSPVLEFPAPPPKAAAKLPAIVPQFRIQVASFQTNARAERVVQQLTRAGLRARVVPMDDGLGGRLMTVLVGNYPSEMDAAADLTRLRRQFRYVEARLEPFVSPVTR